MDAEIKAKWVKALRSGRYKQATGTLEDNGKNCCLGVLCRVVRAKKDGEQFIWGGESERSVLPTPLRQEVSITLRQQHKLASMNDNGKSFAVIADYIEANL